MGFFKARSDRKVRKSEIRTAIQEIQKQSDVLCTMCVEINVPGATSEKQLLLDYLTSRLPELRETEAHMLDVKNLNHYGEMISVHHLGLLLKHLTQLLEDLRCDRRTTEEVRTLASSEIGHADDESRSQRWRLENEAVYSGLYKVEDAMRLAYL